MGCWVGNGGKRGGVGRKKVGGGEEIGREVEDGAMLRLTLLLLLLLIPAAIRHGHRFGSLSASIPRDNGLYCHNWPIGN